MATNNGKTQWLSPSNGPQRSISKKQAEVAKKKLSLTSPKARHLRDQSSKSSESPNSDKSDNLWIDSKQKVFYWFEDNDSQNDGGDIYSAEWRQRLKRWDNRAREQLADYQIESPEDFIRSCKHKPAKLGLEIVFLAHPISTFALWHLLQASYQLDQIICGTSLEASEAVMKWQEMAPFPYLASEFIKEEWKVNLIDLASQLPGENTFLSASLEKRLWALFDGIQTLTACLESFEKTFCKGAEKDSSCSWIPDPVRRAVNERLQIINLALPQM